VSINNRLILVFAIQNQLYVMSKMLFDIFISGGKTVVVIQYQQMISL